MAALKELNEYRQFMGKAELHKAVNSLVGMLEGIAIDGTVNSAEVDELRNWYTLNSPLMDCHPFNEIFPVISAAMEDGILEQNELDDILWLCNKILHSDDFSDYFSLVTSAIQELEGLLHGIMADNKITDDELTMINHWMNERDFLCGTYPFDEIYSLLVAAQSDGVITEDERNMLRAFFSTFIDTRESYNINEFEVKAIQSKYSVGGICAIDPEVVFPDKTFCFTGISKRATRREIADEVTKRGGVYHDAVTKETDYLIVGADGNPCWAFSCYGRKVEKAIGLRKAGATLVIVNEFDFWDAI